MNSTLLTYLTRGIVLLVCLPIHECAHAWMADKLGDPTGRLAGRISLNPVRHLSLMGTLMIMLFGFGYAKPVPVGIRNFPPEKRKGYFALTAAAGPISNLIMACLFILGSNLVYFLALRGHYVVNFTQALYTLLVNGSIINISLAVFNMLPVPPLDGSRLFTAALPDRIYYKLMSYERYFMFGLFAVIFVLHRMGISPLSYITGWVYRGLSALLSIPFGI